MNKFIILSLASAIFISGVTVQASAMESFGNMVQTYDVPDEEEIERARQEVEEDFSRVSLQTYSTPQEIQKKYSHIDKKKVVPQDLLVEALTYFDRNKKAFKNQRFVSVVDFGRRSHLTRLFIINMSTGEVVALRTTHGQGSDKDNDGYAESFGNVSGSGKSSLGFYKVAEDYYGRFGHSIRLDGLSSTNSRARARAVVIHGYDGVYEKNVLQSLTLGCIGLSWGVRDWVVANLKGGSLLYAGISKSK